MVSTHMLENISYAICMRVSGDNILKAAGLSSCDLNQTKKVESSNVQKGARHYQGGDPPPRA